MAMIVECPTCSSRYDVTGRPVGTKARCRCGTMFVLPHPREEAATLQCPRCGGNVLPTNHSCEFCSIPLLVKSCPRCFSRIFHGSKHCGQCGASVVEPAMATPAGDARRRRCPRCEAPELVARLVGDFLLDECPACTGIFVDVTALERMLSERRQARLDDLLGLTSADPADTVPTQPAGPMYVKCPDCEATMNRKSFARGAGVIVDVCRHHGTWFDAEELPRVIAFAASGGIERAQRADARRMMEDARRAKTAAIPSRAPISVSHGHGSLAISAIAEFMAKALGSLR